MATLHLIRDLFGDDSEVTGRLAQMQNRVGVAAQVCQPVSCARCSCYHDLPVDDHVPDLDAAASAASASNGAQVARPRERQGVGVHGAKSRRVTAASTSVSRAYQTATCASRSPRTVMSAQGRCPTCVAIPHPGDALPTHAAAQRTTSRRSVCPAKRRVRASFPHTQTPLAEPPRLNPRCPRRSSGRRELLPRRTTSASSGLPLESHNRALSHLVRSSNRTALRPLLTSCRRHSSRPVRRILRPGLRTQRQRVSQSRRTHASSMRIGR